jgi:hypothetical protein
MEKAKANYEFFPGGFFTGNPGGFAGFAPAAPLAA